MMDSNAKMIGVKHTVAKRDLNAKGNGEQMFRQYMRPTDTEWQWAEAVGLEVDGRLPKGTYLAADRHAVVTARGKLPEGTRVKDIEQGMRGGQKTSTSYSYGTIGRWIRDGKVVTIRWGDEKLEPAAEQTEEVA